MENLMSQILAVVENRPVSHRQLTGLPLRVAQTNGKACHYVLSAV